MEVLYIIPPFDKLAREWKLVFWCLCCLGWELGHLYFVFVDG
jgi:hypothetical protein